MKKIINVILKKPLLSITLTIIFFTFLIVFIIVLSNSNKNNYKIHIKNDKINIKKINTLNYLSKNSVKYNFICMHF